MICTFVCVGGSVFDAFMSWLIYILFYIMHDVGVFLYVYIQSVYMLWKAKMFF